MNTKICTSCKQFKKESCFGYSSCHKDGLRYVCKICDNTRRRIYNRTEKGLINRIFAGQLNASKKRGHLPPSYSKEEFLVWILSQKKFHDMYSEWKQLDYPKSHSPSVDRKDDCLGYTIDNIQLMTWIENDYKWRYRNYTEVTL